MTWYNRCSSNLSENEGLPLPHRARCCRPGILLNFIEEYNSDRFLKILFSIIYSDGYGICHSHAKGLPRHPPSLRSPS